MDRNRTSRQQAVRACVALLLVWAGVIGALPAASTAQTPSLEYPIKAAYLLNFAKLTEWPRTAFRRPDSPITIGIVGTDPFGDTIDAIVENKRINNRSIVVHRLQWEENLRLCQILFLGASESGRMAEITARVGNLPILIVGDTPDMARGGATIAFKIHDGRVRFDVNVGAARRARLNISSQVLTYATIVRDR